MSKQDQVLEEGEEESEEIEEEEEEEVDTSKANPKEQSKEPDITLKETHNLAKAIQKGYTLTRQEISKMRENQNSIQIALENLGKKDEPEFDEEEPLTVKKFLQLQKEQGEKQATEKSKINEKINDSIDELKADGIINTKEEEDSLLEYAVKHKITDLNRAASQWKEWYDMASQNKAKKAKAKNKVRIEAGQKVGTSKKASSGSSGGVDYNEIRNKSISEIADEE